MDLAEAVEDLICTFDPSGDTTMDTLAMFVFGWILVALFVLWLGRLIYAKVSERFSKTTKNDASSSTAVGGGATAPVVKSASSGALVDGETKKTVPVLKSGGGGYVPPTPPIRKRLTRQSPAPEVRKAKFIPAPTCTGPDNVCVLWVNDVLQWLYNDFVIVNELLAVWIQSLNEYTKKSVAEVRIFPFSCVHFVIVNITEQILCFSIL